MHANKPELPEPKRLEPQPLEAATLVLQDVATVASRTLTKEASANGYRLKSSSLKPRL